MRLTLLFLPITMLAAIGDRAPSIPTTLRTKAHPHIGAPDTTFLNTIWNGGTMVTRYRTAADNWNSASPGTLVNCRRLLIAYLAEKQNSGASQATYLQKIKDLSSTVSAMGAWTGGICASLAYDWTYADLDATSQANYRTYLYARMTAFESAAPGYSPYNDQFYVTGSSQTPHLLLALAVYPDDAANSLPHLRWGMDMWFNGILPVWKQVIGGGCTDASTDSATTCGGAWHEGWSDYLTGSNGPGMHMWFVMPFLAWKNATGDDIFTREGWMKNFAYWTMYQTRPDMTLERLGAQSFQTFTAEYAAPDATPAMLAELAEIYNDPTLRGWARLVNWGSTTPDGYEPSAWPYYAPDTAAKSTNTRTALSKVRDFPGVGTIYFRTGWGEDDTMCTLRYGPDYWSHPIADTGAFTCYNRGALAIRSGSYRPGSASPHFKQYTMQAISQNVPLIMDSNDAYAAEDDFTIIHSDGSTTYETMPNDGGQRRIGSEMNITGTATTGFSTVYNSPIDVSQWYRSYEYYKRGILRAFTTNANYSYAAVDITAAYNNVYSGAAYNAAATYNAYAAGTNNRSKRVQSAIRNFIFIPRGTAAYVVIYDQIVATNSTFPKTILIHTINEPSLSGASWTVTRDDLVVGSGYSSGWTRYFSINLTHDTDATHYQYAGKMYGWLTLPATGTVSKVGGAGHEFDIGGINYDECMQNQCTASYGTGPVTGYIAPVSTVGPIEAGGWRIEQTVATGNLSDSFLSVMLYTNTADTNTVSTVPSTSSSGSNWVTTWKDATDTCTYTLTLPKTGIGGTLTTSGAGCVAVIN